MTKRLLHSIRFIAVVVLTGAVVGCSNPAGNLPTAPSEAPDTLASHGGSGGNARYYGAQMTTPQPSIPAGTTTAFAIKIENCNGAGTCDGIHVSASNAVIGHAYIGVPAGFTNISNLDVTESAAGDAEWHVEFNDGSGRIELWADAGNKRINRGEYVTVTFNATAPCVAPLDPTWQTSAFMDVELADDDTPFTVTPAGSQPSVAVTGTCQTECTVKGQGYWEHHFSDWPAIGSGLTLGNVLYNPDQLLDILEQNPVAGNGLIALAHQLVSAKLNIANGENGASIAATIAAADTLIGNLVVPPVGTGSLHPSQTGDLTAELDDFNSQCED